jgi:hypothetical protein
MTESQEPDSRNGRAESPPGVPRWVKISGLVTLIVAAVLVVVMLVVGGEHGPGLHTGIESSTAMVGSRVTGGPEAR